MEQLLGPIQKSGDDAGQVAGLEERGMALAIDGDGFFYSVSYYEVMKVLLSAALVCGFVTTAHAGMSVSVDGAQRGFDSKSPPMGLRASQRDRKLDIACPT